MSDQFATIYILCYGDYFELQRRLLHSLARFLPPGEAKVVVWGNQLSGRCKKMLSAVMSSFEDHWYNANEGNMPKYEVMRYLWHGNPDTRPTTPWVLWFDDDTHVVDPDWWEKSKAFLIEKKKENICYAGFKWYKHHEPGQAEFIAASQWYKGVPWEQCPTRRPNVKKPGITFANGAYFWLRTDVMKQLDWPDPRLVHNGGDTLLGEAVRQQGLPFHELKYGVRGNDARRRGRSDAPAGSKSRR